MATWCVGCPGDVQMQPVSVVLVDDDPQILGAVARILRELPVALRVASSAREALRQIEERVPALVISDLRMPEMDGIELLAQVRDRFPGVRCVLHTGEAPEMTRHLGLQVLTKPCLPSALSELVLSLVEPASPPTKP